MYRVRTRQTRRLTATAGRESARLFPFVRHFRGVSAIGPMFGRALGFEVISRGVERNPMGYDRGIERNPLELSPPRRDILPGG